MCVEKTPWEKVCEFHGHVCPGLAVGYRMTALALEKLEVSRSVDEELIALVENDACGVDAVQVLAGCTFGKGNLLFLDHGKQVYTLARRSHGRAVRVAVRYGAFHNPELAALRSKVNAGEASGEEKMDFINIKNEHIQKILSSGEENFDVKFVEINMPPPAKIHQSLPCDRCGEPVMETRAVAESGETCCPPCARRGGD